MATITHSQVRQYGWSLGGLLVLVSLAGSAWYTAGLWWPILAERLTGYVQPAEPSPTDDEHADGHTDHVVISPQAQKNIGLALGQIQLRDFEQAIILPAMVAERPGRSHIVVTTHFTGIVTKIYVAQGQAVKVGQPLFDLRLTHEELIQSQTELLKTVQEIELVDREIARIEKLAMEGAIPSKTLLDRKYERERSQARLHAQRQSLLLHEMTDEQIDEVLKTKQLLGSLTILALADEGMIQDPESVVLQVHELKITLGQHINAGDTLAVLTDYSQLLVEGEAFEQDMPVLSQVVREGWSVELLPATGQTSRQSGRPADREVRANQAVKLLYLADQINPSSRTFHFYAALDNEIVHDAIGRDGRRYVQWRHRPGERLRVRAPVERWPQKLVVPLSATAQDGVETYVFRYVGGEFQRLPVQVEYRDEEFAVLADDGSVRQGMVIAMTAAQQVQFALANQSGAAVDPHAGHQH